MSRRSMSDQLGEGADGAEGNERLTAVVAVVLLVLLFLVGLTVPVAYSQTRWHVFLGVVVIPPVLLKVVSTTWRFVKYYGGNSSYQLKGPPALLLRLLGPVIVVLTLIMLFSGVGLVIVAPSSMHPRLSQIHQLSFILWFAATTVHVLGHLKDTAAFAPRDFVHRTRRQVRGASLRAGATLCSVALGLAGGWAVLPYVHNIANFGH